MWWGRMKKFLLICMIVGLTIWGLLAVYKPKNISKQSQNSQINIAVQKILPQSVNVQENFMAFVTPIDQTWIKPFIAGYVQKIFVNDGQSVAENQKLIQIKQDEYIAALKLAKANLQKAVAQEEYAKSYYQKVLKTGEPAFSKIQIQEAKQNFLSANAQTMAAKANLKTAQINLDYTTIKSQINGVVGNIPLSKGDFINPNMQNLFSVVKLNPIRVVFSMTDKEYLKKQNLDGFKFKLLLADNQFYEHEGQFKYTDNQINKSTNSLPIYVDFENPDHLLMPNAYVNLIMQKNYDNVVLINQKFAQIKEDATFVNVLRNKQIVPHKLEIIAPQNQNYVVKNNFEQNDMLIAQVLPNLSKNSNLNFVENVRDK